MILKDLIAALEVHPREQRVPVGFHRPHSYRGFYYDLAFEPLADTTVGAMLDCARSALGATYEGWKGGEYTMGEYTSCWVAEEGNSWTSQSIGPLLLAYMLGKPAVPHTGE